MQRAFFTFYIFSFILFPLFAQPTNSFNEDGSLTPEQTTYDVQYYDLSLKIDPEQQRIAGSLTVTARIVHPTAWLVLDLDSVFQIQEIIEWADGKSTLPLNYHRKAGEIWIELGSTRQANETITATVAYRGIPPVAKRPPWMGGFTWRKTPSDAHWIATTCQTEGADLWWPCKDHVSDKPDSMRLHITVPQGLVVASNGVLENSQENRDGTTTWHWHISNPISNYNVALNIAPYQTIDTTFTSVGGETFPVIFWALPEDYAKAQKLMPEILDHLLFFEKLFGPYPFRSEKYGIAQTPHLGMEHQTIIAYGANFSNTSMTRGQDWGFDALHHHELAHEWWGNLMTNYDWRDMWLHEGFGSYMQPLYMEQTQGTEAYIAYMKSLRFFLNNRPIAPRTSTTEKEIYKAPIYTKGAWTLHTLRFLIGDQAFFQALRRMAYPDPAMEQVTDGRQVHFAATDDFIHIAETASGKELDWFFEIYLRQKDLPILISLVEKGHLNLRWKTPNDLPFPMPIEVKFGDEIRRIEVPVEGISIPIKKGDRPEVDPNSWLLMEVGR